MTTYNVLMMGASYGSLLATKLLFGGHNITLVCLPAEVEAFNSEGARVRMPIRGRKEPIELDSRKLPGSLRAAGPGARPEFLFSIPDAKKAFGGLEYAGVPARRDSGLIFVYDPEGNVFVFLETGSGQKESILPWKHKSN